MTVTSDENLTEIYLVDREVIMHDISNSIPVNWRSLSQKVAFVSACIGVAFLYLQFDRSPAPDSRAIALVDSPETIANVAIGAIATVLYIRAMYPILTSTPA